MRRGEITGNAFDITTADIGMPFRSSSIMKRKEIKSQSIIDNLLAINDEQQTEQNNFQSYDPNTELYAKDITEQINPLINDDRLDFDRKHRNNTVPTIERIADDNIQNMSAQSAEYLNSISCNIFNDIANKTIINFCISPISMLSTLIKNDPNIKKIMSLINCDEIFHQTRINQQENAIISRASIKFNTPTKTLASHFMHYEDNMNNVIEFPMVNKSFSIGFICNKQGNMPVLTSKLINGYIINLKHSKCNIYCPSFKITNKINMNQTFMKLGYLKNNLLSYLQTIYFEIENNIYIKNTTLNNTIDLSENFIFYIRYIPNNVILFIGRHGSM
jgi:hypothetical protein